MKKKYYFDLDKVKELIDNNYSIKEISCFFNAPYDKTHKFLKKNGFDTSRKLIKANRLFFNIVDKNNSYWAGFIAADGNIKGNRVSISLKSTDNAHLLKFKNITESDYKIYYRKRKKNGKIYKSCNIYINSVQMKKDLKNNFNIVPKKTKILQPPNLQNIDFIRHFIRGYFDGDGSICWDKYDNKPRFEIACGSYEFIFWIKTILTNNIVNITNPSIHQDKKYGTYKLDYSGYQIINIMKWLYEGSNDNTKLDRKFERFLEYNKKFEEWERMKEEKQKERNTKYDKILFYRKQGMTYDKISKLIGMCIATCYNVCKKYESLNDLSQQQ